MTRRTPPSSPALTRLALRCPLPRLSQHTAVIWGMHVAAEHQEKGYGRALLIAALDRAREVPGLALVRLSVESTNEPARTLYASLGFDTYGVERRALLVGGKYYDEELMALELD